MEKLQQALDKAREIRAAALRTQQAKARDGDEVNAAVRRRFGPVTGPDLGSAASAWEAGRGSVMAAGVEKIQHALGKASRARRSAGDAPPVAPAKPPINAPTGAAQVSEDRDETGQIRLFQPLPQVLQANRVLAGVEGAAADAFRILRTQLLARLEQRKARAVAICAAGQGDGKTLTAVNLAVALVRQLDRRVLLVDLDLRRPSVHRYFGLRPEAGVSDFLLGRQPLTACLINLGSDRLILLPQARSVEATSELLASPRMGELVRELKMRYPDATLIYDCPPLLTTDDPLVAMGHADGCLLVVHEGKTRKAELLRAAELVGEERLFGTVLNNARWSSASNYYYG